MEIDKRAEHDGKYDNEIALDIIHQTHDQILTEENTSEAVEEDPWALPEVTVEYTPWSDLTTGSKVRRILWDYIGKTALLLGSLYFFVCSLDLLSDAFRLLSGKTAGSVFKDNSLLENPVAGLMVGVLATVLLQSSSTTTGIVISLVVAKVLEVKDVIPIVMGANIGTSVTNTIVSMGQITTKNDFRRAFAGATVHDMFNWVTVIVLLPLEVATEPDDMTTLRMKYGATFYGRHAALYTCLCYLYKLTGLIVSSIEFPKDAEKRKSLQFLKTITKPFTKLIIQVDKNILKEVARGNEQALHQSIIKHCCKTKAVMVKQMNATTAGNSSLNVTEKLCVRKCEFLFESVTWSDSTMGVVILVLSLILLSACFITIVKTLYTVLRGHILSVIKRFINANFPGKLSFLTGYVAILIGTGLTMIVQSSSVVTSALTPLVGIRILSLERMYPITLGANLGTTFTAVIIALSQSAEDMPVAFHVALCHMFFNISGILVFYPLPVMRIPIKLAKFLGNETAKYRWFGIAYMIVIFVFLPSVIFGLSSLSWTVLVIVMVPVLLVIASVLVINLLQSKAPDILPGKLKTWNFLPLALRSLVPYDSAVRRLTVCCRCCHGDKKENIDTEIKA